MTLPSTSPHLSILIPSMNSSATIQACVESALGQKCDFDFEVIVADASSDGTCKMLQAYERTKIVRVEPPTDIDQLRLRAVLEAQGEYLLMTEDHATLPPDWAQRAVETLRTGCVYGGPIVNFPEASQTAWAAYFARYARYQPGKPGSFSHFSAMNIGYPADWLKPLKLESADGFRETFVNKHLAANGVPFVYLPENQVMNIDNPKFGDFFRNRFQSGRRYAAVARHKPGLSPWVFAALSPALPVMLMFRIYRELPPALHRNFFTASPILLFFLTAWTFGEFLGAIRGN